MFPSCNFEWYVLEQTPKGVSLAVQWLRLCAFTAGDVGSIPAGGTKIPYAVRHSQKKPPNKQTNKKTTLELLLCMPNFLILEFFGGGTNDHFTI